MLYGFKSFRVLFLKERIFRVMTVKAVIEIVRHSSAFRHWLMLIPIKTIGSKLVLTGGKLYLQNKVETMKHKMILVNRHHVLLDSNILYIMYLVLESSVDLVN